MAITKSYNKQNGLYYAYETTYVWDENLQKKVQHKRCIGKFDPETGEVIPNGKVGRPLGRVSSPKQSKEEIEPTETGTSIDVEALKSQCSEIETALTNLTAAFFNLKDKINGI